MNEYLNCNLCPRNCGVNRYEGKGYCGAGAEAVTAKTFLHKWEEPCISYKNGAGTVFFSGCCLHCVYCQNNTISSKMYGSEKNISELSDLFLEIQDKGADNIELVTPSHFTPSIVKALEKVKHRLSIPVIFNTGGYEKVSTLKMMDGYIDVYMPDIKYFSSNVSQRYSNAPDYFAHASEAVKEMTRQAGNLKYNSEGGLLKGTLIRHLVLPNQRHDSMSIMKWISENLDPEKVLVSIMNQYTPFDFIPEKYGEIKRKVTKMEYNSVVRYARSLDIDGFTQQNSSASEFYVPDF